MPTFAMLRQPETFAPLTREGDALVAPDGTRYPIKDGIPRFVSAENYAADFGWQWKEFRKTQLDSFSGLTLTRDRLDRCLNGHLAKLAGKDVLEAGSGAGRFTEVLLQAGANLCSLDLSVAVEANAQNHPPSDQFVLVQADVTKIPFAPESFEYVICLGVVQHTPDPELTIRSLYNMVRPGGYLSIDHYMRNWRWDAPPPIGYAQMSYRKYVLSLPKEKRYATVKKIVDFWFDVHWRFRDSKLMRALLPRLSPVAFYYPGIALNTREAFYEWALLDTHDSLTDYYKHWRTPAQIEAFLRELGATELLITRNGNGVEAFCRKPL